MNKGVFITGTDTGVGKTVVAAGLAGAIQSKGIDVGIMKPVASGATWRNGRLISNDVQFLAHSISSKDDLDIICPVCMEPALSPLSASLYYDIEINIEKIHDAYIKLCKKHDMVIVEGIGGILVPIKDNYMVSDMIKAFDLPVVIVARPGLGTINHSLLTINEIKRNELAIKGFIINGMDMKTAGFAEKTNPEIITRLSGVPCLGILPFDPNVDESLPETGEIIQLSLAHLDIETIFS